MFRPIQLLNIIPLTKAAIATHRRMSWMWSLIHTAMLMTMRATGVTPPMMGTAHFLRKSRMPCEVPPVGAGTGAPRRGEAGGAGGREPVVAIREAYSWKG